MENKSNNQLPEKKTVKKKKPVSKKLIIICILIAAFVGFFTFAFVEQYFVNEIKGNITMERAATEIEKTLKALPKEQAKGVVYLSERLSANAESDDPQNLLVKVNSVKHIKGRGSVVNCDIETLDLNKVVVENSYRYMADVFEFDENYYTEYRIRPTSTETKKVIMDAFMEDLKAAEKYSNNVDVYIYDMGNDKYSVHLTDETINSLFGNYKEAYKYASEMTSFEYNGKSYDVSKLTNCKNTLKECFILNNYSADKPDTSTPIMKWINSVVKEFELNFLEKGSDGSPRYMYIIKGLGNTLLVTFISLIMGIVIGFIVAVIRVTNATTGKLEISSWICQIYLSIMRGTPLMIQLLIIYFVILLPVKVEAVPAAILCFGLNSGAYVSEIVRGGIMSVDKGQMEAGRSIGFTYVKTMWYIILPQAFKAVLPSLANEFITLLKETSVAFYIGVADLTLAGNKIRSQTYTNFMPLIAVAIVYLILVLGLSKLVSILERRLRKGDNR